MSALKGTLVSLFTIVAISFVSGNVHSGITPEWSSSSPHRTFPSKGIDLMDQYDLINESLEREVPSQDDEANFDHIDEMLKLQGDKAMEEALLLFQSLRQLKETNQCDLHSYNILKRNYNAANGLTHWGFETKLANRRVNKIVKGFLDRHAANCTPLYFDLYRKTVTEVDQSEKELAESLVKNLIFKRLGQEEGSEVLGNAEKLQKFAQEYAMTHKIVNDPVYCLQEMRRLAQNDPNSKYVEPQPTQYLGRQIIEVNEEELAKLFTEYLHKPCKDYVEKMETIFMPASYDTEFLVTPAKQDELDYYLNWAAFEVCDVMVSMKSTLVHNIAEYENRMTKQGTPF